MKSHGVLAARKNSCSPPINIGSKSVPLSISERNTVLNKPFLSVSVLTDFLWEIVTLLRFQQRKKKHGRKAGVFGKRRSTCGKLRREGNFETLGKSFDLRKGLRKLCSLSKKESFYFAEYYGHILRYMTLSRNSTR